MRRGKGGKEKEDNEMRTWLRIFYLLFIERGTGIAAFEKKFNAKHPTTRGSSCRAEGIKGDFTQNRER